MIKLIDDQLARILERLEEIGRRDNTIVIYNTDYGESLGGHGLLEKGCRFYEGLVHVPLIVSWPGVFRDGLVADASVEFQDQAPSLLQAAGVPIPESTQGRSLLPILLGNSDATYYRDFVRSEYLDAIWMDTPPTEHCTSIAATSSSPTITTRISVNCTTWRMTEASLRACGVIRTQSI